MIYRREQKTRVIEQQPNQPITTNTSLPEGLLHKTEAAEEAS